MTASLLFSLASLLVAILCGCGASAHDGRGAGAPTGSDLVSVRGELLADGSCRATVGGAPLFTPADAPRAVYDSGAVADIAPAGYALHQLACAPAGADPSLPPERRDERMVLVTLYVREGASLRPGRYTVRAGLADAGDSAGVASRAGIAIFGSRATGDREASGASGASGAGVRYLEAREGALEVVSVEGAHVVGRFDVRAGPAWSM